MGKKKHKKVSTGNSEVLDYVANCLDYFIQVHRVSCIVQGISKKKYDKAIATIEHGIEKLRNGKIKGVMKKSMVDLYWDSLERDSRNNHLGW